MKTYQNNRCVTIVWIILGTLGRLIPHPANVTPINNLCLFAGSRLSKKAALLTIAITLVISDILLAYLNHYPIFSLWSLFTYTGFIAITLLGSKLYVKKSKTKIIVFILVSSLGFWLWTNFGVWLTSGIYAKNINGLVNCYIAALPFLRNALLGNLVWGVVIFGSYSLLYKRQNKPQKNEQGINNF